MIAFYGKHGPSVPPIDDQILLESATSIAEKIRTKEVSVCARDEKEFQKFVSDSECQV